jgi:hypothetical protein
MRLNNVNPDGESVVAANLDHAKLFFSEKYQNWFQKQASYVFFFKGCGSMGT